MGLLKSATISDRWLTAFLLLALCLPLAYTGGLSRLDNLLYDIGQKYNFRSPPSDVIIVAIDEQSLEQLGRWPWPRQLHARLIERLHQSGAKAIGLDILLSEPQRDDAHADEQLAKAMQQAGNVVLPLVIEQVRRNGQFIESLPIPELSAQARALGLAHAELDADSIARSITLWEGIGEPVWPHFAQAILTAANQWTGDDQHSTARNPSITQIHIGRQQLSQRYIQFSSGRHHFQTLSYAQVLNGEYPPGTFRDKLVLVGATAAGLADSIPTPISGLREPTPGVEFLANTVVSMRDQTLIQPTPYWLNLLLTAAFVLLPLMWLPRTSPQTGLLANLSFGLAVLMLGMLLPLLMLHWLPVSTALLGIFISYPIWALRKLQATTRFMDQELLRLGHELGKWATRSEIATHPDPIQNRILHIQMATTRLVELEQQQRETLACISHDIRSPIASAAEQIKKELGTDTPIYRQLTKVLHWTEDFLHISRVQMLEPSNFTTLDLIDLLHQTLDELYPLAQQRQLEMIVRVPSDPQWILGHFDSLQRAIGNLLGNAIKFADTPGSIGVSAACINQHIHVVISNQGPDIPAHQLNQVFKRFSQGESTHSNPKSGFGLGLYYVQTVAEKHGATIKVTSQSGTTEFTLMIPALNTQG